MDLMYKEPPLPEETEDNSDSNSTRATTSEENNEQDDAVVDEELHMMESFHLEDFPSDAVLPDLSESYLESVKSIRYIVRHFRHGRSSKTSNFYR
jgi:hypothetical protein